MSIRPPGVRVPAHERVVLDNGLTLLVVPRRDVPLIAFNAVLRGGACGDVANRSGTASLLAGLLEKGAGDRDAFSFADAVEGVGGTFNAAAGAEAIAVRGQFLARDQELMLELLADALLRPRCAGRELEILRNRQIELIKAAKDSDPAELLGLYGRALLFQGHPYGRSLIGSEASLAAIRHADVLAYQRAHVGSDRLTLIVTGDVDSHWLEQAVRSAFASWSPAQQPRPVLRPTARVASRRVVLVDSPGSAQSYFWIGSVGVDRHYARRAALDLANTLYGGRFTSILNTALRVRSGLSYGARSGFARGSVAGEFAIRSFARAEDTTRALDLSLDTLAELKALRVTPEMLDSARAYVLGQYPLNFETAADWAAALGELELYGLGPEEIESYATELQAVTPDDIHAVIEDAFPSPQDVAIVLIGDAQQLESRMRDYGPLTSTSLIRPEFEAPAASHAEPAFA